MVPSRSAGIWAEVQNLAAKNDEAGLHAYITEAQRMTSSQRNVRVAREACTLEGKKVEPGNVVVMMLVRLFFILPAPLSQTFPSLLRRAFCRMGRKTKTILTFDARNRETPPAILVN